jgi:hypothetical protein
VTVTGQLNDLSVVDLIQIACSRQMVAALTLQSGEASGLICFDQGEIVHAETETVSGEGALYQILAWKNGSFSLTPNYQARQRSLTLPWRHLLLEGMRLSADQLPAESGTTVMLSPQQIDDDSLETGLVSLFSTLERECAQITKKANKQPELALQRLTKMANLVVDFGQRWLDLAEGQNHLSAILEKIGETNPQARYLQQAENPGLSIQALTNLYVNWKGNLAVRNKIVSQIARGLSEVIKIYLQHIIVRFQSPQLKTRWNEINQTFHGDVLRAIDEIKF